MRFFIPLACFIATLLIGCSGANIHDIYETTPASMSSSHIGQGESITIDQTIMPQHFIKTPEGWQKIEPPKITTQTTVVVIMTPQTDGTIAPSFYVKDEKGKWQKTIQMPDGSTNAIIIDKEKK